jgi:hypothetical protein
MADAAQHAQIPRTLHFSGVQSAHAGVIGYTRQAGRLARHSSTGVGASQIRSSAPLFDQTVCRLSFDARPRDGRQSGLQ